MTSAVTRVSAVAALVWAIGACGYAPVNSASGTGRLHVKLVRSLVPDAIAADEVAQGVREELARSGALEGGEGYPRVEIEVIRASESSEGVVATPGPAGAPQARATGLSLVARGWVVEAPGGDPERDTGDLRVEESIAVDEGPAGPDPRASTFHADDALRAAARRVGTAIGRRVLGLPAAADPVIGP
jgi:hypothetical protein